MIKGLIIFLLVIAPTILIQFDLRVQKLKAKSKASQNRIINFRKDDFQEYIMKYPRPYDVVIFFTMNSSDLGRQLYTQYEYLAKLYQMNGAIGSQKSPTFFARIDFVREQGIMQIFRMFQFESVPNMVVSKQEMAVIAVSERSNYLKQYTWQISYKDNHVTAHKMLEFVNKRTNKNVIFRYTNQTIQLYLKYFVAASAAAVLVYYLFNKIWNHWILWLIASLVIYTTCVSGIVYCIIHNIPLMPNQNSYTTIFTDGRRQQSGLQGWFVSSIIMLISLMFILLAILPQKCSPGYSSFISALALAFIYMAVMYLQKVYRTKGWYGPSFYPPMGYLKGPLNIDQGNNI